MSPQLRKDILLKISPNPLCEERGIPLFCKARLTAGRGGKKGFSFQCPYNDGPITRRQITTGTISSSRRQ
jgi:hypothetical protein